jgi:tRNA nucleotidyltransferase/poly(A) polymerase
MREDSTTGDGRRPDSVKFTDINTDSKRRDLTINALYYDIDTKEIIDLVGGVNDLQQGIIRTVGNPIERFKEDKLRILRLIRFAGRFGSNLDPEADAALRKDASLEGISGERIRDEFIKGIISSKSVVQFLQMIEKYHLFDWIFRGLNINKNFISDKDPILVIASLLKDNDPKLIGKKLNDLKYTVDEIKNITFLINLSKLTPDTAVILKRMQKLTSLTDDQLKKFGAQQGVNSKLLDAFIKFRLTVNGEDLMKQLNLKPGKELGDAINKAEYDNFKRLF